MYKSGNLSCMLVFAGLALYTGGATDAAESRAARLESFMAAENTRRVEDAKAWRQLASTFVEKKIGPAVSDCLEILNALAPNDPELAGLRTAAESMPAPAASLKIWAREQAAKLRKETAKGWIPLMTDAGKQGFRISENRCASVLLLLDPENKEMRKVMGHVKVKKDWVSEFDVSRAKSGFFCDPEWGYVTEERKKKLDSGMRPRGGAWITKAEDEALARTWADAMRFDDPKVILVTDMPFDHSLAIHKDLKALVAELDFLFGDVFRPASSKWPLTVYFGRTQADLRAAAAGDETDEAMAAQLESFRSRSGNRIYCQPDAFPAKPAEAYSHADYLRTEILDWYLIEAADASLTIQRPNAFIIWGMEALVRSRGMKASGKLPEFGCFKDYKEGRSGKRLPPVSELCGEPAG